MAPISDIGTLIVRSAGIVGGRPRIAGTGVSVRRIVGWYNTADFSRLPKEYMSRGSSHSGIILARQQRYSAGLQMRCMLGLLNVESAEDMKNSIEFLGAWA